MKTRFSVAFAIMVMALVGSSYRPASAQFFPGAGTQLWSVHSEGCIAAVQTDVASQFTTAASSVSGNTAETTWLTNTAASVAADLTALASANPHAAVSVNVSRYTSGSSTTIGPSSSLPYQVNPLPNFKGC